MSHRILLVAALAAGLVATPACAQHLAVSLRGGGAVPFGSFAAEVAGSGSEAFVSGAGNGFGYGLDASFSVGAVGVYAGFDQVAFGCESAQCARSAKYRMGGVSLGVRLAPAAGGSFAPWLRAGITFHELRGEYGEGASARKLTSDRAPGYEFAAGVDVPLAGVLALSPQVRYVGQNLRYRVPGVQTPEAAERGVGYLKLDLGLSFRSALGGSASRLHAAR